MSSFNDLINLSFDKKYLLPDELPAIDLYIDQVITVISQRFENNSFAANDKPLTKMMVNNYSKADLINPIKGKKYTREQIVQMLIVCSMKGVLSLGEIKNILDKLYSDKAYEQDKLFACYEKSVAVQQNCRERLGFALEEMLSSDSTEDKFTSLMAVCAMADSLSELAARMTAEYFTVAESEKKSKKKD